MFNFVVGLWALIYLVNFSLLYKISGLKITFQALLYTIVFFVSYYLIMTLPLVYMSIPLAIAFVFCTYQFYLCYNPKKEGSF